MALLAFLCVAPARGNPRNWPRNCLKIYGGDVILWDKRVGGTGLRVSFFMLLAYLERTADQARSEATLRQIGTVESLRAPFPRPARAVALMPRGPHNALWRLLSGVGEGRRNDITPQKIRAAFLVGNPLNAGSGLRREPPEGSAPL